MENTTKTDPTAVPKLWTASFLKVLSANTMSTFGNTMLTQALPLYIIALGSTKTVAGLVMGFFTITALIFRPFYGILLDTKGRRFVLLIGTSIVSIASFGFSLTSAVMVIFIIRSIQGAGYSGFTTSAGTIVADVLPRERLNEGIGYYGVTFNIAMAFAPMIALFLRDHFGYQTIFITTGLLTLLALGIASTLNYEKKLPKQAPKERKKLRLSTMFEKTALPGVMVLVLITLPHGLITTFLVKYSETLGIEGIGLYFTFNAVFMILSRLLAGRLCDRFGVQYALPPGLVLIFAGMLLIAFGRTLTFFLIAGSMLGFGYGVLFPTIQAFVIRSAPADRRGAATATYYSSQDVGRGTGSILGGVMTETIGFSASFALFSLFIVGAFAVFFLVLLKKLKASREEITCD